MLLNERLLDYFQFIMFSVCVYGTLCTFCILIFISACGRGTLIHHVAFSLERFSRWLYIRIGNSFYSVIWYIISFNSFF